MIQGNEASCEAVGILPIHGAALQGVADRADTIVLFRDPGPLCAGLAAEHYAMKGFRIHAKSCDWGPMAGLVCMDPRLNKDPERKTSFNRTQNLKAIRGEVEEGMVIRQNFTAGVMPLVISQARLEALRAQHGLQCAHEGGGVYRGTALRGGVSLPWVAIPVPRMDLSRLGLLGPAPRYPGGTYLGLFIDHRQRPTFHQEYLPGVGGVYYKHAGTWFEWLLGMTNTDRPSGFKDSVTGDFDLFAVWPRAGLHAAAKLYPRAPSDAAPRVAGHLDQRPLQYTGAEYAQMGNISERVQYIAFQVNDAVRAAGYLGGDACSHSDEAQNPFARDLVSCFPPSSVGVIAFLPRLAAQLMRLSRVVVLQSSAELKQLGKKAREAGYHIDLKDEWLAKMY
jgi:hypothetical protein